MNTPGFPNTVVEALEFQDDVTLYAFTHGRGAFRAYISPEGDDLAVAPAHPFETSGPVGGAFSPSNQTYTLRNTGMTTLNWSASDNVNWLSVSPGSGTELGTPAQPYNTLAEAVAGITGSGSETIKIKGYTADNDSRSILCFNRR